MPNYSYDINKCESLLKSEAVKLTIIAIFLTILFASIIVFSIFQIRSDKSKKMPYIQLVASLLIFVFLFISLGTQILSYNRDIADESYVQYEGSANIETKKQIVFGAIPTGYTEYIISFELDGEQIELYMRKNPDTVGYVDKIFIVYSKHSKHIIDFEIVH